jgi:hypothetical protein
MYPVGVHSAQEVDAMAERDNRYDASRKGKKRRARYESSEKRRAYQRRWMKAYRKRQKKGGRG